MAQAPTYNDIRANQQAQAQAVSAAQAQQATGQQVQGEVQSNKNTVLDRAMAEYAGRDNGLGNPNAAVMNATNMAQGRDQEQYATSAVDAVINGKLDPAVFMEDPSIPDDYKTMVLGLMQGGPQDQAPVGLGQVR